MIGSQVGGDHCGWIEVLGSAYDGFEDGAVPSIVCKGQALFGAGRYKVDAAVLYVF